MARVVVTPKIQTPVIIKTEPTETWSIFKQLKKWYNFVNIVFYLFCQPILSTAKSTMINPGKIMMKKAASDPMMEMTSAIFGTDIASARAAQNQTIVGTILRHFSFRAFSSSEISG